VPEGDTVFLAATRLRAALEGQVLTKTDFRVPSYATLDLSGRAVHEVVPRGKHLLFRVEGGTTIHSHFKMDGAWHVYPRGRSWRGRDFEVRAVLENAAWAVVGYRLGIIEVLATKDERRVVGHLGPDVLGPDWDADEVRRRMLAAGDRAIGEVLLDQGVIAGPGNIYKSEICFLSGVDPRTPVREVPDLERVIDLTKRLMEANRFVGTQVTTGDMRPGRGQWVYGRAGKRCRRCGSAIRREEQEGHGGRRVTFWCPQCQPAPGS